VTAQKSDEPHGNGIFEGIKRLGLSGFSSLKVLPNLRLISGSTEYDSTEHNNHCDFCTSSS
jgi:hypothetical protein